MSWRTRITYALSDTGGAPAAPVAAAPTLLGAEPAAAPAPTDPRAWLPEAYRGDPTFADIKDMEGLSKSYKHAATLVGIDRAEIVRLPKDPAAQEWDAVFNRLGRPEKPDGYEWKAPEGLPPEVETAFRADVHKLGLTKSQAAGVLDFYGQQLAAQTAAQQAAASASEQETIATLKKEWGAAFPDQLHAAHRALDELGGPQLAQKLVAAGLTADPDIIRFFAKLGMQSAEPGALSGGSGGGVGRVALTPEAAQREIRTLQGDKTFFREFSDRSNPNHANHKARWDELHKYAYPEAAR